MKKRNNKQQGRGFRPVDFEIYDGSGISSDREDYSAESYLNFVSNGMTNNEKIDACDYYEEFLNENH